MFSGNVIVKGYPGIENFDALVTLVTRFKKDFGYNFEKIENDSSKVCFTLKLDLKHAIISVDYNIFTEENRVNLETENLNLETFSEMYNYLLDFITYREPKIGETVYYEHQHAIVKSTDNKTADKSTIIIKFDDGSTKSVYKNGVLRFN